MCRRPTPPKKKKGRNVCRKITARVTVNRPLEGTFYLKGSNTGKSLVYKVPRHNSQNVDTVLKLLPLLAQSAVRVYWKVCWSLILDLTA